MLIIDGGERGVFGEFLKPRLEEISEYRDLRPVPARLTMVSHIDSDHIAGIEDLLKHVRHDNDPLVELESLWHNSFDSDINTAELAALADLGGLSSTVTASLGIDPFSTSIAAGVGQGKRLRKLAREMGLVTNAGGQMPGFISEGDRANLGHSTRLKVLNPDKGQLQGLRSKWDGLATRLGDLTRAERRIVLARIAENSLANISSIVVHIERSGRSMLLTGDARGDHVISGLRRAGLLPNGKAKVDILKIPHHGSNRNVDTRFFNTIHADHYIFSGDRNPRKGTNPDQSTFEMVARSRGNDRYAMHFTYIDDDIDEWIAEDRARYNRRYDVYYPGDGAYGIWVDLEEDEPLWF